MENRLTCIVEVGEDGSIDDIWAVRLAYHLVRGLSIVCSDAVLVGHQGEMGCPLYTVHLLRLALSQKIASYDLLKNMNSVSWYISQNSECNYQLITNNNKKYVVGHY